jgi:glucose/arabinose dehydrogenase
LESRRLLTALPTGFAEAQVGTSDFVSPTAMAVAPDGRVFVAEQSGEVRVIKDGNVLATPLATVPNEAMNEWGLVGIEVDPNFATNHYVYVTHTAPTDDHNLRLTRYTASGDVAQAGSATLLYETGPMRTSFHNGGAVHFGPDGRIYLAVGENGGGAAAQDLASHKGKILRINPDGSVPADNPFVSQTTGNLGAIWAIGLRNPFTFAVQPTTGRLFANDVGTNVWEEVDDIKPGGNYGYPAVEGPTNDPRFTGPVYSYQHDEGCAIVGAAFYNPSQATQFPADYTGDYFFGELCKRTIRRMDPASGEVTTFATALPGKPVDIDVAADGSLYYLVRPNPETTGQPGGVFRVTFANSGAPGISVQPQDRVGSVGRPVTFSVTASGTGPFTYQWQRQPAGGGAFADVAGATGASYTLDPVSAADDGARFRVVVTNAGGTVTSSAATLDVTSNQPPVPVILTPADGAFCSGGDTISFSGSATDAEDGTLPAGAFTWRIDLHHEEQANPHTHPEMPDLSGVKSGTHTVPVNGHTESEIFLRVLLTVRDSAGLETTVFRDIRPNKVNVTLATNVPGLRLNLDGMPVRSPQTLAGVSGIQRTLEAPPAQTVNGVTYQFVSWSDGGAAAHAIATPAADQAISATYAAVDGGTGNPGDPDLSAAVVQPLPAATVKGAPGRTRVRVTNTGSAATAAGGVKVVLFVSPDPYLDPEDPPVTSVTKNLRLAPGKSANVAVRFNFPDVVDGAYYLLAYADADKGVSEHDEANNVAATTAPVTLAAPFVDLSPSLAQVGVKPGPARRGTATLLVRNAGNVPASGFLGVELRASSDTTPDAGDPLLLGVSRPVKLKAGGSKRLRLTFVLPQGLAAGSYYVTAATNLTGAAHDANAGNNAAVSAGTVTAG